jgi:hypothetical protein
MAERNPSKQRRAAQNKAQREALAARRARASEPKAKPAPRAEPVEATDEAPVERRRSRFRPAPQATETGRPSRAAPARRAPSTKSGPAKSAPAARTASGRPGRTPPAIGPDHPEEPGLRGFLAHLQQIAGGKAVLFALIFAVVAAGTMLVGSVVARQVVEAPAQIIETVVKPKTKHDIYTDHVTLLEAAGPIGFAFAALPIIICAVALEATRRPGRRRAFTIAAFALGIYVVFFSFIGIFFFFSMAGLFFAAYQARKADPPVPRGRARARARDEDEADEDLDEDDEDED